MKFLSSILNPTNNRRLNELVGFLLCVSATLLFLALASYSPLDPSINTAARNTVNVHNWIGMGGANLADLMLQLEGMAVFLFPALIAALGARWFRSRKIESPMAK